MQRWSSARSQTQPYSVGRSRTQSLLQSFLHGRRQRVVAGENAASAAPAAGRPTAARLADEVSCGHIGRSARPVVPHGGPEYSSASRHRKLQHLNAVYHIISVSISDTRRCSNLRNKFQLVTHLQRPAWCCSTRPGHRSNRTSRRVSWVIRPSSIRSQ